MGGFGDELQNVFDRFDGTDALDILLIAFVIYWVFLLFRGTTAIALLRGGAIILVGGVILGQVLNLEVLNFAIRNSLIGLIIAVPIIFQPEIRRALERVGRTGFRAWARPSYDGLIARAHRRPPAGAVIMRENRGGPGRRGASGQRAADDAGDAGRIRAAGFRQEGTDAVS